MWCWHSFFFCVSVVVDFARAFVYVADVDAVVVVDDVGAVAADVGDVVPFVC